MAGPILYPLLNGVKHDFTSIEVVFGPHILIGFKSVNYSRTRSRSMVYGTSPDPIGKTRGKNEYKADCEIYLAEFDLVTAIPGYGDIPFTMVVNYSTNGIDTVTDVLLNCTFDTTDASNAEGTDATVRKVELNPTKILFGGKDDMLIPLIGVGV